MIETNNLCIKKKCVPMHAFAQILVNTRIFIVFPIQINQDPHNIINKKKNRKHITDIDLETYEIYLV